MRVRDSIKNRKFTVVVVTLSLEEFKNFGKKYLNKLGDFPVVKFFYAFVFFLNTVARTTDLMGAK